MPYREITEDQVVYRAVGKVYDQIDGALVKTYVRGPYDTPGKAKGALSTILNHVFSNGWGTYSEVMPNGYPRYTVERWLEKCKGWERVL